MTNKTLKIHLLCAVLFPEVLEIFIADLLYHVERFAHEFLLDDLQQFVLLQRFTRHVQWQIIRVNL